jgi:hypothetical protein
MIARGIGGPNLKAAMTTDRPINEYETALFGGLMILIRAVAHRNLDSLAADLRHTAKNDADQGHENAAAALEMLAQFAETDAYCVPKSPFMVIKGGKTDPENSN